MEARNRSITDWFQRIRTRQISLPRFQRMEAWGPNEVAGLLTTVLRGLPGGATLILEIGDELPFVSRTMVDAPEAGERITELLLDGQQRLTALWRALHDKYSDRTYLIRFEEDPHRPCQELPVVDGLSRWVREGRRFPLWADNPKEVWGRGYIPIRLLRPGDITAEIDHWTESVAGEDFRLIRDIDRKITQLRERVASFNLPFLSLPVGTPREVALDVFIKMNTSSVSLTTFDIMVAQVESAAGESLHDLVAKLREKAPTAERYKVAQDLILEVAALMQDRVPSQTGYAGLDLDRLVKEWDRLIVNVKGMVEFLESQSVFDSQRLPTDAVLAVIAALWGELPAGPDALGNAKTLLRKYLWRSFFTGRYDRAAATAALNDYRALRDVLQGKKAEVDVLVLNEAQFSPPTIEQLILAGWPKNRNTLARAILALCLRCGGRDIADDSSVTREHLSKREYHHLFPVSLLEESGVTEEDAFRALNCSLITWKTNRTIADKEPLRYLRERIEGNSLGEEDLDRRLRSHLIEPSSLKVGGYDQLSGSEKANRIRQDYEKFLQSRAKILQRAITQIFTGREVDMSQVFEIDI